MTTTSEVFTALKSCVDAVLPGYKRLENPFVPEDNASNLWDKAYGIAIGPGGNPELFTKDLPTCTRDFFIVLVNKLNTTDTQFDKRDDQQNDIAEDMDKLKVALDKDPDLKTTCTKAVLSTDSGVNFIDAGRGKFFLVEGTVETLFFA